MKITQIRNATIIADFADSKFLLDPWLGPKEYMPGFEIAMNAGDRQPRVDLPFAMEKIVDVDAVILTHYHPDHWDEYAQKALPSDIKFFVQSEEDKAIISKNDFTNIEIIAENGTRYKEITLYKTGGQHGEREIMKPLFSQAGFPYETMGVIFKANNEPTLYIAGDTIWCEEVKQALDTYQPEIVVVNACAATVLTGDRLIMNLDDLNQISGYAPSASIIASHMDTVSHRMLTREDIKNFIKEKSIKNIYVPDDGETIFLKKNKDK